MLRIRAIATATLTPAILQYSGMVACHQSSKTLGNAQRTQADSHLIRRDVMHTSAKVHGILDAIRCPACQLRQKNSVLPEIGLVDAALAAIVC